MRPATKSDWHQYSYKYIMLYVDDVMVASHNALNLMKDLGKGIKCKNDTMKPPTSYLGVQLKKKKPSTGNHCWNLSSDKYANAAIANVEESIKKRGRKIPH